MRLLVDSTISYGYTGSLVRVPLARKFPAGVAELVYAYVSEAYGESLESSNLSSGTNIDTIKDSRFRGNDMVRSWYE